MSLKKIPEGPKGEGLRKLKAERPDVTKKMGFAKKGKMLKANAGKLAMIKQLRGKDLGPAAEEKLMKMPIQELREKVREKKMTKARTGKMIKANIGMSVKGDDARDIRKVEDKIGASRSSKREKGKMAKGRTGQSMKAKTRVMTKGKLNSLRTGGVLKANVGMAAKKVRENQMMKASMGKSVRGYGAARTSGMGLQDESLPPGKSLDYYKDLM